jgi:hypothetical protein
MNPNDILDRDITCEVDYGMKFVRLDIFVLGPQVLDFNKGESVPWLRLTVVSHAGRQPQSANKSTPTQWVNS